RTRSSTPDPRQGRCRTRHPRRHRPAPPPLRRPSAPPSPKGSAVTVTSPPQDIVDPRLSTAQWQRAIDEAAAAGGGRVTVPAGVHRLGALRLRSGIELHLEAGALLQFVPDPALYPAVEARWGGAVAFVAWPFAAARAGRTGAVAGLVTIAGGGHAWWVPFRHRREQLAHPRPSPIGLHDCERVTIRDVALLNSPAWTVHPSLCEDVTL